MERIWIVGTTGSGKTTLASIFTIARDNGKNIVTLTSKSAVKRFMNSIKM